MNYEDQEHETVFEKNPEKKANNSYIIPISVLASSIILSGAWVYTTVVRPSKTAENSHSTKSASLDENITPTKGVVLPVVWGDTGKKLVENGVINGDVLRAIYEQRGGFTKEQEQLLFGESRGKLRITKENSGYLLNLFWALGLGSKNVILEAGEMSNKAYGGAQNFASTGGWTVAKGNPMDHFSRHQMFNLTPDQQERVERVSKGVYRPCCGNPTHFPDCNHGMAMLGLLELMASQGRSEKEMWDTALRVNSYWFPGTYKTIATYLESNGVAWDKADPEEVLGINYSSSAGYKKISSQVSVPQQSGSGGCGVDTGESRPAQTQQGGCGI